MKKLSWKKHYPIVFGFLALCWFLIRVIPKPTRAAYPCQRAAFPIASAFVIWLISLFSTALFYVRLRRSLKEHKLAYTFTVIGLFGICFIILSAVNPFDNLFAGNLAEYTKVHWNGEDRINQLNNNVTSIFDEVGIVKSPQASASDIEFEEIESMVRESVFLAGGISDIITNGDYVVLKPNLVALPPTPTSDYVEVSGMCTDWRVVKAVAKMVRELNPDGKIYVIESSAASSTREIFDYYNYTLENIPEVDQIVALEDSCGIFDDFSDNNLDQIFLDDGIRLYPDEKKPNLSPEFYINKIYNNADIVISIPVLKNHQEAVITGGIKNVAIGMTPPNIYGMTETFFGKWTKIDHSPENLHKWLHDFYLCKPVDFVVVDGLQGFDHGPTGIAELSMEEMQHNMKLIISGNKALSVDAVCGYIMSIDPTYANYMVYLDKEEYNVGTIDSRFIRIKGEHISNIRQTFHHITEIATNAIYTDYYPPNIGINSTTFDDNTITFAIQSDDDLAKVELQVNGVLLNQICVTDFTSVSFDIDESLIPIDNIRLIASDRFYNETQILLDLSSINEPETFSTSLDQNYPNPFVTSTSISFSLQKAGFAKLYVSNINGRLIETIVNKELQAGKHKFGWKGDVASGTYYYILEIEGRKITKVMIKN